MPPKQIRLDDAERAEVNLLARVEKAKRAADRKDILAWGQSLFPHKFPLPFCSLHRYLIDVRANEMVAVEAPRGHAKTAIGCFLVQLFQAVEEPETFNFYLNVQATEPKALAVNRSFKMEVEESREFRMLYGNMMGRRWTDEEFVLSNGVVFKAVTPGQRIRGVNYRNRRPDYITVDDLYDKEDINNPVSTQEKNDWFWSSLYPARAKGRKNSIHLQGTAINCEDLLEKAKSEGGWEHRTFRAIDNNIALWPELNTIEALERDRVNMGSLIFARELQNERRDDATSIVKRAWLKGWEYDPSEFKPSIREPLLAVLITCDPSVGEKNENDSTGIALVYITGQPDGDGVKFWIAGLWNVQLSLDARVRLLDDIAKAQTTHKVTKVRIESISGFKDFTSEVVRRTKLPVQEIDKVKDKITNLENKSHYFENGKIKISREIDPMLRDMLTYQLTVNHPKNDDLRDAVLLALDATSGLWDFV